MRRLRKYSESLGGNYSWRVVSSCEQNSMQAIATNDDILIYDPKDGLYCRQSEVVKNGDLEAGIFDIFTDDTGEIKRMVMRPAKGDDFNKFAAEWDALQKEDRPDIIKTKKTTTFAFNTNESRRRMRKQDQGMDELVVDWYKEAFPTDTDMFEDMEDAGSTFADVWDALDNGEDVYAVIGADDSIVRERVFEHLAELTGKDYDVIYNMWMDAAYDYVDDFGEPVHGGEAMVSEDADSKTGMRLDKFVDELSKFPRDKFVFYWWNTTDSPDAVVDIGRYLSSKEVVFSLRDRYYGKSFQETLTVGRILDVLDRVIEDFSEWTVIVDRDNPIEGIRNSDCSDSIYLVRSLAKFEAKVNESSRTFKPIDSAYLDDNDPDFDYNDRYGTYGDEVPLRRHDNVVDIQWTTDSFEQYGILKKDIESIPVENIRKNDCKNTDKIMKELLRQIRRKHPELRDVSEDDFRIIAMDVSTECSNRWSESTGRLKPIDSAYLDDNDPDFVDPDEEEGGYDPDSYDF